jgi:hypothetical protein
VTRNRRRAAAVATAAGDDGVGVAGLDAVRQKTVLRRDETEPARARHCVGRSPGGLERSEHGVAVDGVGGRRAARLAEVRERSELRVVKRLARVPEEAVDLGVAARKRTRRAGSGTRSAARRLRGASCSS